MRTQTLASAAVTDLATVESLCNLWGRAWNHHDGDAVAALCAEDLVYDEPALGETVYGRDAIRDFVNLMTTMIPDYSFELVGVYAELTRRSILVAWHLTGTVADTDQPIEFHGDDRLELGDDGLIRAYRCLYDNKYVLSQLAAPAADRA
ncbi:MAG: nuclear transport factor 2 family protein [Aeromicrobium sp.]